MDEPVADDKGTESEMVSMRNKSSVPLGDYKGYDDLRLAVVAVQIHEIFQSDLDGGRHRCV